MQSEVCKGKTDTFKCYMVSIQGAIKWNWFKWLRTQTVPLLCERGDEDPVSQKEGTESSLFSA